MELSQAIEEALYWHMGEDEPVVKSPNKMIVVFEVDIGNWGSHFVNIGEDEIMVMSLNSFKVTSWWQTDMLHNDVL